MTDLLAHPWLTEDSSARHGPILSLQEMLDISEDWRMGKGNQDILEDLKNNAVMDVIGFVDTGEINREKLAAAIGIDPSRLQL